jgi:hypothetical protein
MIVGKPKSIFTDHVSGKSAKGIFYGQNVTIVFVLSNFVAQDFDFLPDDRLELQDASPGEQWVQGASTELVEVTV